MAVSNTNKGAAIEISRGRKGERPSIYPARIAGDVVVAFNNGRPQMLATVIALQTNLSGEEYLAESLHNLAFAFDRHERVIALDGTSAQPKTIQELVSERASAAKAFLATLPEADAPVSVDTLVD